MCEITKMKTHIVIHIEKGEKCGKLSYTLFYPHYPQTKKTGILWNTECPKQTVVL